MTKYFDSPSDMEPMLPRDVDGSLADLGLQIIRQSERLRAALHPVTGRGLGKVVQVMNSYYSHFIEGHSTTAADLDAVFKGKPSGSRESRHLQRLHLAHVSTQQLLAERLQTDASASITSPDFISGIHADFYNSLPEVDQYTESAGDSAPEKVDPGEWRKHPVSVGRHLAPSHAALSAFMNHFNQVYSPQVRATGAGLVACAAAHHRLVWIHPFSDGNGRVARLFSQCWLQRSEVDAHGLWSISRGLARSLVNYRSALSDADQKRKHDTDGRGYLSEAALKEFCRFFLLTCLDQLVYMSDVLAVDTVLRRIEGYSLMSEASGDLPVRGGLLLREVWLRGEIPRGDAARVIGKSARSAQTTVGQMLATGHLVSLSPKGQLRMGFPRQALAAWFPGLLAYS
jgi:Fic family protein